MPPPIIHYHSDSSFSSASDGSSQRSSVSTVPSSAPSFEDKFQSAADYFPSNEKLSAPRDSYATYSSTVESFQDDGYQTDSFESYPEATVSEASPSDPHQFAQLFPTKRCLIIKHDDSVADGAMNLRVDAELSRPGRRTNRKITLFYWRMYDLESRKFTLRRYGRDCGREVANTQQKYCRPASPFLGSKAFQSLRKKSEPESGIRRQDSGYSSCDDDDSDYSPKEKDAPKPTKRCALEFSNYAHVDLERKGAKGSKKYDFEYWGNDYSWKRTVRKDGIYDITNFELFNMNTGVPIAALSPLEHDHISEAAQKAGKFVPPSFFEFKLSDAQMKRPGFADLADVAIATGLMSLVDDCIKRNKPSKKTIQFVLPVPTKTPKKINMEYVGAKRMIEEICRRTPTTKSSPQRSPVARANSSPARLLFPQAIRT